MIQTRLYLITDRKAAGERTLDQVVDTACKNGIRLVQLREKDLNRHDLFEYASRLREITARYGAKLVINNAFDVALAVEADGVHLSEESVPISEVRQLNPNFLIGKSTHSQKHARQAQLEGADYIFFGPVFHTPSKSQFGPPKGLAELSAVSSELHIPVFAVGGITPENANQCLSAGVAGVAVIRSLMSARDISRTLQSFNIALV